MAQAQFIIRLIILALFVIIALLCIGGWRRSPERRLEVVALLSLVLHVVLFYGISISRLPVDPLKLNLWSAALRVHEGALILVGVWLFLWPARDRR